MDLLLGSSTFSFSNIDLYSSLNNNSLSLPFSDRKNIFNKAYLYLGSWSCQLEFFQNLNHVCRYWNWKSTYHFRFIFLYSTTQCAGWIAKSGIKSIHFLHDVRSMFENLAKQNQILKILEVSHIAKISHSECFVNQAGVRNLLIS